MSIMVTGGTGFIGNQGNTLNLDWTANGEADLAGYKAYRSATSGSGYAKVNTSLESAPSLSGDRSPNLRSKAQIRIIISVRLQGSRT